MTFSDKFRQSLHDFNQHWAMMGGGRRV